jgi:hypothetical protein
MQLNVNQYDQKKFQNYFVNTELYKKLQKDYEILIFEDDLLKSQGRTPRQLAATRQFSVVPFYYLNILTDQNPSVIYDLGCGWNIFKKYIPGVIGVGAEPVDSGSYFGDIPGKVDSNYVREHQNYFDSVFSINALHFYPLRNIRKIVLDFISMLAPGGYGFLTLNLARMIALDFTRYKNYTVEDFENYVRTELSNVPAEYKVFDVNFRNPGYKLDNFMDGNIRLICHKTI